MKKISLITGSARRIGRHIALFLAKKGHDLILHYNTSFQDTQTLCAEISKLSNANIRTIQADLSTSDGIATLCKESFEKKNTSPNLLISNASLYEPHDLKSMTQDIFDKNISVNLKAPIFLMKNFAKNCSGNNSSLINILDTNISNDSFDYFSYNLAKRALAHATRMVALEYAPRLRVNGIALGYMLPSHKDHQQVVSKIPLKKQGQWEDIEKSLEFLIGNSFVTGEILYCDGGKHLCP